MATDGPVATPIAAVTATAAPTTGPPSTPPTAATTSTRPRPTKRAAAAAATTSTVTTPASGRRPTKDQVHVEGNKQHCLALPCLAMALIEMKWCNRATCSSGGEACGAYSI
jgi:hypothetical protein